MKRGDFYRKQNRVLSILIVLSIITLFLIISNMGLTGKTILNESPDSLAGKDAYIRENLDSNFGTTSSLRVGKVASGVNHRSFLEFNFSSIPSTNTIINSTVTLNLTYASSPEEITISIYRVLYPWQEEEITWYNRTSNNVWETIGGSYAERVGEINVTTAGKYSFEITELTTFWVKGIYTNNGLIMIANNVSAGTYKEFGSSDSLIESERPNIYVHHSENAPPIINSVLTNFNQNNRLKIGETATFQIQWSDLESDNAKMFICDTQNITLEGCELTTYCQTAYSSAKPQSCSYIIKQNDTNNKTLWAGMCDSVSCSIVNTTLYMNHPPETNIILPNGGERINQEEGDYIIRFETLDLDNDYTNLSLYYGETKNSTTHPIQINLNSSTYCIDTDFNPLTPQQCTYSWNTAGLYGQYYLTIILNDSIEIGLDSSDNSFNVTSLIDLEAPKIESVEISKQSSTSGEQIIFTTNITEPNLKYAWIEINTTPQTIKYFQEGNELYNLTFESPEIGTYSYQIFAQDLIGNSNSSETYTFQVTKPQTNYLVTDYPANILPNHVIRISSNLTATNPLKEVEAILNISDNFIFLEETPRNKLVGNFSDNETKNIVWYLSAPLEEESYNFNIKFEDKYQNEWQTENYSLTVSTENTNYNLVISSYPEVETNDNYYAQATFTENAIPTDPDSITISLYDPAKQLTVGPVSMQKMNTGKYNFTYLIGSSPTEGQWETIINATKLGISYYANTFWKLTGGPFDVRNIQILNSIQDKLAISITTENTGGANKDLILNWNLTRMDNGQHLDSGTETFMVEGYSQKDWTVYPNTDYVGQVKITFIGYYGFDFTEKAGAYKIFTIEKASEQPNEQSSSSSGQTKTPTETQQNESEELNLIYENPIKITKEKPTTTYLRLTNNGDKNITNIKIKISELQNTKIEFDDKEISQLEPKESKQIQINLTPNSKFTEQEFYYIIDSDQFYKKEKVSILILENNQQIIDNLLEQINFLKSIFTTEEFSIKITDCEKILKEANETKNTTKIKEAEKCIKEINEPQSSSKIKDNLSNYMFWIITWILIIILVFIVYRLIKQMSIINLINKKPTEKQTKTYNNIEEDFEKRIKDIEKNLR